MLILGDLCYVWLITLRCLSFVLENVNLMALRNVSNNRDCMKTIVLKFNQGW